ncbi:hypothetical protein D3C85_1817960 [compost metagenome]
MQRRLFVAISALCTLVAIGDYPSRAGQVLTRVEQIGNRQAQPIHIGAVDLPKAAIEVVAVLF